MSIWDKWKQKIQTAVSTVKNAVQTAVNNTKSKIQSWIDGAKSSSATTTPTTTQPTPQTQTVDSTNAATATDMKQIAPTEQTKTTATPLASNIATKTNTTTQEAKSTVQPTAPAEQPVQQQVQPTPNIAPQVAPVEQKEEVNGLAKPDLKIAPEDKPAIATKETPVEQAGTEENKTEGESTMSQVNNQDSANEDRFLQWYKEKFGQDFADSNFNKTEGMSDKDYETGNNLYQAYLQKQNLQKQYDSAAADIDASKAKQRQEASILRDKMSKYLNLQNKNSGLNNLGVSESVGLQADAQYANNLGNIESNAEANKKDLLNNYLNNKTNIDTQTAQNEQSILNKYQQYEREDEQKAYERQKYEEEIARQKEQEEYERKKYEEERDYQRQQDEYNKNLYKEEKEENKEQADKDNAYVVAQATLEDLIASGNYDKARQYLEDNKGVFGDSVYNTYQSQIGTSEITTTTQSQSDSVNTFLAGSYGSVSDTYTKYKEIMKNLDDNYSKGLISEKDYNDLKNQMNSTTSKSCSGGWYIQGLGSGRNNDDIDLTIGSSSRKGNGAREYDLLCGSQVTDKEIEKQLNKLATGSENNTPAREGGWTWLHGDSADSKNTDGKLVVFMNQMFLYTSKGWVTVKGDHDDVQSAINAFLGK